MQRQIAQNALLWQTPSLGLAAQAFLLTASLNSRTGSIPRAMAAALGVLLAMMTMQLMAKHRYLWRLDRELMLELEVRVGLPNMAEHHEGTDIDSRIRTSWMTKLRSYWVWQTGLALLLATEAAVLVLALRRPDVFSLELP